MEEVKNTKTVYLYQLSLADGSILMHESEGLYSTKDMQKPDDRILINSATLVKIFEKPVDVVEQAFEDSQVNAEPVEPEVV